MQRDRQPGHRLRALRLPQLTTLALLLAAGCSKTLERRAFAPQIQGEPVFRGISYGPFREGQRPGGTNPTAEQILEDLQIIAQDWQMIR